MESSQKIEYNNDHGLEIKSGEDNDHGLEIKSGEEERNR